MSESRKGEAFTVYIHHDVKEALIRRSKELDRTPSWLINNIVREPLGLPPNQATHNNKGMK